MKTNYKVDVSTIALIISAFFESSKLMCKNLTALKIEN